MRDIKLTSIGVRFEFEAGTQSQPACVSKSVGCNGPDRSGRGGQRGNDWLLEGVMSSHKNATGDLRPRRLHIRDESNLERHLDMGLRRPRAARLAPEVC